MIDIFNNVLTNIFRAFVTWRLMISVFPNGADSKKWERISYGFFFLSTSGIYLLFHFPPATIAANILSLFVITVMYKSSIWKKILVTVLVYGLNMSCDLLAVYLFSDYQMGGDFNIFATYVSVLFFGLCVVIINAALFKKKKLSVNAPYSWLLLLIPIICILLLFLFMKNNLGNQKLLVSLSAGVMCINLLTFFLYYSMADTYQKLQETALMERQLKSYENQLNVLYTSNEKISSLRHDMKNHLHELFTMAERAGAEDLKQYISEMQEFGQNQAEFVHSGNYEIDCLLNYLFLRAEQNGCRLEKKICVPQDFTFSAFDFNVMIGNLLDNAIKAASETEEKKISLTLNYEKGLLYLQLKNSYRHILRKQGSHYLSTKEDAASHGIGLRNVKHIVDKYNGSMEISEEPEEFQITVILYLP